MMQIKCFLNTQQEEIRSSTWEEEIESEFFSFNFMFLSEAFIARLKYNEKLDHYRKLRNLSVVLFKHNK